MKEIRTIKMVEQTEVKFVADDGKEFTGVNAERECATYERQKNKAAVEDAFARLDAVKVKADFIDWFSCGCELWKIKLNSKKDYFSMVDYFTGNHHYFDNYTEIPTEFPYTMFVTRFEECINEYKGDIKAELLKAYEQLGG